MACASVQAAETSLSAPGGRHRQRDAVGASRRPVGQGPFVADGLSGRQQAARWNRLAIILRTLGVGQKRARPKPGLESGDGGVSSRKTTTDSALMVNRELTAWP